MVDPWRVKGLLIQCPRAIEELLAAFYFIETLHDFSKISGGTSSYVVIDIPLLCIHHLS